MKNTYTNEQLEFLAEHGANCSTKELTTALNRKFSVSHSAGSVRTTVKKLGIAKTRECRSRICAQNGEPIGSTKIVAGYQYVKVRCSGGGFYKDWERVIRMVWEHENGSIPDGFMVVTLDGNPLNETPENLCAIPKSVAARMARGHGKSLWSDFPEVTRAGIEACKLDEAIAKWRFVE